MEDLESSQHTFPLILYFLSLFSGFFILSVLLHFYWVSPTSISSGTWSMFSLFLIWIFGYKKLEILEAFSKGKISLYFHSKQNPPSLGAPFITFSYQRNNWMASISKCWPDIQKQHFNKSFGYEITAAFKNKSSFMSPQWVSHK